MRGDLSDVVAVAIGIDVHRLAVDREQHIAGSQHAAGGVRRLHDGHLRAIAARMLCAECIDPPQQQKRDEHVHGRPGADHNRQALPHRLAEVGAVGDLLRNLLVGVHARDAHVAAEWNGPDCVLGLPTCDPNELRWKEQREALHAHPHRLGSGEVPKLVQHDQCHEPQDG